MTCILQVKNLNCARPPIIRGHLKRREIAMASEFRFATDFAVRIDRPQEYRQKAFSPAGGSGKLQGYLHPFSGHPFSDAVSDTASARAIARGTMLSTSKYSSGLCAAPPTGPVAHSVGVPTAEVKPESAQPPVASPSKARPARFAAF